MSNSNPIDLEQTLRQCCQSLDLAHRNQDWNALVNLEAETREVIEQVFADESIQTEVMRHLLGGVQLFYKKVIDACQQEQ